jgi:hypothetical protein
MYFVTTIWRSALHIDPMRLFPEEEQAQNYARDLKNYGEVRIYLLSSDAPPKRIKLKERDE